MAMLPGVSPIARLNSKAMIISGYLLAMSQDIASRHETLMKPVRSHELVAAVNRAIGKLKLP